MKGNINNKSNQQFKKTVFNDSDDENDKPKIKKEEYDPKNDNSFVKALRKNNIFSGKEGRMLFELEQKGRGDERFKLSKSFKGDVSKDKVSNKMKQMTDAFDEGEERDEDKKGNIVNMNEKDFQEERNKNLNILSSMLSNTEFLNLNTQKKIHKANELITKRYDPLLGLGKEIVQKKEEEADEEIKKNGVEKMKLLKGYNPLIKKSTILVGKDKKIVSKESKDNDLKDVINYIQEKELKDVKVEVDFGFFRNLIKSKEKEKEIGEDSKDTKDCVCNEKKIENMKMDLKESNEEHLNQNERLLKKKRKLEKKEKEKNEKKEKEMNQVKKEEKREMKFKKKVLKNGISEEKYDNYMRMINLISDKKKYRMNIK